MDSDTNDLFYESYDCIFMSTYLNFISTILFMQFNV